ncbi:DUF2057 family protein [Vibrio spartinae]|uniref:UPF0319 protein VSP9026_04162 n=1 Tax=Vibrio spartinae TaxID=1918945 RepID=A0A1N6MA84_9VIBR|nr:DUF2057 family protein [Vibrio spartinae]QMV16551.1 hypothetical protein Vspart_03945 [Vibrio spartinae]SIO96375.1 hypothetical protein VSP9026_04162 [Vibrio spartinae]
MNISKALSFTSMILLSGSAMASVTIDLPEAVNVLVANGGKANISSDGFFSSQKKLQLEDGLQQIVFRYEPFFQEGKDNIGIESDVTVAVFNAADAELTLQVPQYRSSREAREHISGMQWSLTNQDGQKIPVTQDKLLKDGIQFGRNYYTEMSVYNQSDKVASVPEYAPQSGLSAKTIPARSLRTSSQTKASATTAETMLHYWYEQADAKTRSRFKQFINQQ